jgi:hypothetical protein
MPTRRAERLLDEQLLSRESGVHWRSGGTVDVDEL